MSHPIVIQGGMGAGVSDWRLARAVSTAGQLGVISSTALDTILARRLAAGDPDGHMRRALAAFPDQDIARRIIDAYFDESGEKLRTTFVGMYTAQPSATLLELTIAANFVEVWLAKEGHDNPVGMNLLEKIQLPVLPSLYGAMLAGIDCVIVGAGIPREIPGILDSLAEHNGVSYRLNVEGAGKDDDFRLFFDPRATVPSLVGAPLKRPAFYPVVSSNVLATTMVKKATGSVEGLVIEKPSAGGHNAPPRGGMTLDENGEPTWGAKDEIDLDKIRDIGLPFWLGGCHGTPEGVREALDLGAAGVQAGTVFAFCVESGFDEAIKQQAIATPDAAVFTDPKASPTGFPFKVLQLEGTLSDIREFLARKRVCNLGYLRHVFKKAEGVLGYRCPAEPESAFLAKGGRQDDLAGRKCLCNALLSNIGLGSMNGDTVEKFLVTAGNCFSTVKDFLREGSDYTAAEVLEWLLSATPEGAR